MRKLKMRTRLLAAFLIALLTLGTLGIPAFAAPGETETGDFTPAPYTGDAPDAPYLSDSLGDAPERMEFSRDDVIDVIVVLEEASMLDYYPEFGDGKLSDFLSSTRGGSLLNALKASHSAVKAQIASIAGSYNVGRHDYYSVLNGFSLRTEYGNIAEIERIDGVKKVYISENYTVPDNPLAETEDDSYIFASNELIGAGEANGQGYTGKGVLVGIVDSGFDLEHEAFNTIPSARSFSTLNLLFKLRHLNAKGRVNQLYKNGKVVFSYDYSDSDNDVFPGLSEHGQHVAGTAAGYAADDDGNVLFSGVAPDAQLALFKVSSDVNGSISDAAIFAALEDAVILGVDTVNLSIGSDCGFSRSSNEIEAAVYDNVLKAGINFCVAAGNAYYQGYNSALGIDGQAWNSHPDYGVIGNPATFEASIAVASVSNSRLMQRQATAYYSQENGASGGVKLNTYGNDKAAYALFDTKPSLQLVNIGGYGVDGDYEGLDVAGKAVLVKRGGVGFNEKVRVAGEKGASIIIIANNMPGDMRLYITEKNPIPYVSISQSDGDTLSAILTSENAAPVTLTFNYLTYNGDNPEKGAISDYSSWGPTPTLGLKPELTAPGGLIYSTLPRNEYGYMNGTSMASPHVAGAAAVVRQYVNQNYWYLRDYDKAQLVGTLLMNTADPIKNGDGSYVSPRKQGAGLINIADAIETDCYLTVDGALRPKGELGYNEQGSFGYSVTVKNTSDKPVIYGLSSVYQSVKTTENSPHNNIYESAPVDVETSYSVNGTPITSSELCVPANGCVTVDISLLVDAVAKANLDEFCEYGFYIDGYLLLDDAGGVENDLTVPLLGYVGDWEAPELFDEELYGHTSAERKTAAVGKVLNDGCAMTVLYDMPDGLYFKNLGYNSFTKTYDGDKIAYTPDFERNNSDEPTHGDAYLSSHIGLLRNARDIKYTITDENGVVVADYTYNKGECEKTFFIPKSGWFTFDDYESYSASYGDEGRFNSADPAQLPDGNYRYQIDAKIENGTRTQSIGFDFCVDRTRPVWDGTKVDKENRTLSLKITENHFIQGFFIYKVEKNETFGTDFLIPADDVFTLIKEEPVDGGFIFTFTYPEGVNPANYIGVAIDYACYNSGYYYLDIPDAPETVNKSELKKALDAAAAIYPADKEKYTEESWAAFETAYLAAVGVYENAAATQSKVNNALDELIIAMKSLVEKPQPPVDNKAALKELVAEAEKINIWSIRGFALKLQFINALNNAKYVLANPEATDKQIENAYAALAYIMNKLK